MKQINYNHQFIYYLNNEIIKKVPCTIKETLEAGESVLMDFGADRVIKEKRV